MSGQLNVINRRIKISTQLRKRTLQKFLIATKVSTDTVELQNKGNCMDNGAMENFFGRLKVEMFYGEQFESVDDFILALDNYIHYCNNERISLRNL